MILIAEAGNSKTDWVLIREGNQIDSTRSAGISPYFDHEDVISCKAGEAALRLGNPVPRQLLYFGTGCLHEPMRLKVHNALKKQFPETQIEVSDDLRGAGIALFGNHDGIAAISGTGSNAGVIKKKEMVHRTNSLGYLLGDEGSGADLGFRFLKHLLSDTLPSEISGHVYGQLNLTPSSLLAKIYAEPRPQTFAATFIPFLDQYRANPAVKEIIREAFQAMSHMMLLPIIRLYPGLPIGFCGSIAHTFRDELIDVLKKQSISIEKIIAEPVSGLVAHYSGSEI